VDTKAASGDKWTTEERVGVRMDTAMTARLAKEAITFSTPRAEGHQSTVLCPSSASDGIFRPRTCKV
ncbi:MAG TPA: hypothetical protein VGM01_04250, partial [Ktedonobacteraceae bacterium]